MNQRMKVNKRLEMISGNDSFWKKMKMSDLKTAKSRRGIKIIFEIYWYKPIIKIQAPYYLACVRSPGGKMMTNPE